MRGGKKYLWERNYDENGYEEILYYEGGQKMHAVEEVG